MRSPAPFIAVLLLAGCTGLPTTNGPSANGALCGAATDCSSGQCVDGVCCESACDGSCSSCAVFESEGVCTPVPDGQNPGGECGSGVCSGSCNGGGSCRYPAAEKVCGEKLCVGASVQTSVCNGAGACGQSTQTCAPYGCESGACKSSCADPSDCAGTGLCRPDGTCEDKLANGSPCGSGTACASNFCADGVCCDGACGGSCEACDLQSSLGTCSFVPAGDDPSNECTGTPPCGSSCDGAGKCAFGAQGTSCPGSVCTATDAPLILRECNGAGQCADVLRSCGLYACEASACRNSCSSNAHCRANAFCDGASNTCIARRALGEVCASGAECASASCVDGVCCNTACQGECASCNASTPGVCELAGRGGIPTPACANAGQACGNTASCPATCSATAPCRTSHYCNAANTCVAKAAPGASCTAAAECLSGFCNDGVCCAQNCANTSCRSCAVAGSVGACVPLPLGFDGGSPPCPGNDACRADGECGSGSCSSDDQCKPTAYCAGAAGCQPRKTGLGQACVRARECATSSCTDGFCCSAACTGACEACNLQGTQGTCAAIPTSQDPGGECVGGLACNGATRACFSAPCASTAACEPGYICQSGACVPGKQRGATCAATAECGPGLSCADGVCCDQAVCGACQSCRRPGQLGTCTQVAVNTDPDGDCAGGNTCNAAGVCRAGCASTNECEPGHSCTGGSCVTLKLFGAACSAGSECRGGFCTDGVCCNSGCAGTCNACNFPSTLGSCTNYPPGSNPGGNACTGQNACNGSGACGSGCTVDSQCSAGSFCNVNTCAPRLVQGAACAADNQCTTNACVDGVCCDTACVGACLTCNSPGYVVGTCTPYNPRQDPELECTDGLACQQVSAGACYTTCGANTACETPFFCQGGACVADLPQTSVCTDDDQCSSGHCEDGRCCDRACTSGCESCNLAGTEGVCSPHAAMTDPEALCPGTFCDGSGQCISPCPNDAVCENNFYCDTLPVPDACVVKKTPGLACGRPEECASGLCVDGVCCTSSCAGTCESCNDTSPGTCTAYANRTDPELECTNTYCRGGGQSLCISPCSAEADCEPGFYCDGAACVAKKPVGTLCTVGTPAGTQCASGNCVDGVCCSTACGGACDRCNINPGTCTPEPVGTPSTCAPYLCQGGAACPTTCTTQAQCQAGSFCDGTNCVAKRATGQACTVTTPPGVQCLSGNCADGFCCGTSCSQVCESCDVTPGTCTAAVAGTDPKDDCGLSVCATPGMCVGTCTSDAQCDTSNAFCDLGGTNTCVARKTGLAASCDRNQVCANNRCVDGYCCSAACTGACDRCDNPGGEGSCGSGGGGYPGNPSCAPYRCPSSGAACSTASCASNDGNCAPSGHCTGTACVNDLASGVACARNEQCLSNVCKMNNTCQ